MAIYSYSNPQTGEMIDLVQGMNDVHEYVDSNGLKWNRVFTKPNYAIDTMVDPHSPKDFVKATNKRGSLGDMLDRSAELHEKRKDSEGRDPVREQFYADYSKKHGGKKHYIQQREENQAKLKEAGIKVKYEDDYS